MLRLVEVPKEGQEKVTSRKPSPNLRLTKAEAERVRAALRTLHHSYRSWAKVAEAMGLPKNTIEVVVNHHNGVSHAMAMRVAKVAGVSIEALLSPLASVDVCPTCGARKGAR